MKRNQYLAGFIAAAEWGWPRWMNPWPMLLWTLAQHDTWNAGYDDAQNDRLAPKAEPKLEPECVR